VFLKALSIKGFKSFADPANLTLEPGITVVVGPNGSGKSNVVDALAWVIGAQAPSAVRSQKMDDVIFAGTSARKALGRAEVSMTIDNSDRTLDIEFTEVTIARTLFRTGESDYSINGVSCRLLDIQELLSDSGVGRQQHVIISQGRIDDVLNSKPEDRRSIIEEAAGVLKYRKRKERAERRLAATEENMQRLQDLLREVRRQVRPLEKQAEAARRHGVLTAELTALKIHLTGRELRSLTEALMMNKRRRNETGERERSLTTELARLDAVVMERETHLASLGASDVADVASRARSSRERIRGQHNVLAERRRRLDGELRSAIDDGLVANLESEATGLEREIQAADTDTAALEPEFTRLERTEAELETEQLTFDTEWGEGLAARQMRAPELRAQLEALDQAVQRSAAELARSEQNQQGLADRRGRVRAEQEAAAAALAEQDEAVPFLEEATQAAIAQQDDAEAAVAEATEQRRQADSEVSHWQARGDALAQALDDARSQAGADALADTEGVLGVLLDLVDIDPGWEAAVEAAAGEALQAAVVDQPGNAVSALEALEKQDLGGAVLALGLTRPPAPDPGGASSLRSRVRPLRDDVAPLLDALIGGAVVVDGGWRQAQELAVVDPGRVVVTRQGDRFGPTGWRIGASGTGATGAALEEAEGRAAFARAEADAAAQRLQAATSELAAVRRRATEAGDALRKAIGGRDQAERNHARAAEQLAQLDEDGERFHAQLVELAERLAEDEEAAAAIRSELPAVENEEAEYLRRVEALSRSRSSLEERARGLAESRKDLEVKAAGIDQRRQLLRTRLAETESRLERLVEERDQARIRREGIEGSIRAVDGLVARLTSYQQVLNRWIEALDAEQQVQSEAAQRVSAELSARRNERKAAEKELVEVRERQNRLDVEATEQRIKLEALTEALRRELDTEPQVAMDTECPPLEEGVTPAARVRDLERELKLIGPINPLALEEFEALKERHEFLDGQLDDVKTTRKDLNALIRSIDAEIVSVFTAAYADVSANFVELFAVLFPGGRGGISLTNPDDILNCGIEIEAKPSGKNVKKLSLLSGGERSLVALAFLFAVFRSRPSPFYVMDEVEAALDDVNLSRFLGLLEEFRADAQLIVVSHQKRTMEAADVLYGVTMKPGGSSKVVSEKVEGRRMGDPVPGA
jgi:chromosome segregation protein